MRAKQVMILEFYFIEGSLVSHQNPENFDAIEA